MIKVKSLESVRELDYSRFMRGTRINLIVFLFLSLSKSKLVFIPMQILNYVLYSRFWVQNLIKKKQFNPFLIFFSPSNINQLNIHIHMTSHIKSTTFSFQIGSFVFCIWFLWFCFMVDIITMFTSFGFIFCFHLNIDYQNKILLSFQPLPTIFLHHQLFNPTAPFIDTFSFGM